MLKVKDPGICIPLLAGKPEQQSVAASPVPETINVKKTTVLNTLVTMTMTSDVENSKN